MTNGVSHYKGDGQMRNGEPKDAGSGRPTEASALPGIEAVHGPLIFQIRLFADGHLDWRSPTGPDPVVNEIMFRGYFDKVHDAITQHMQHQGRIVAP